MDTVSVLDVVEGDVNELLLDCSFDVFREAVIESQAVIVYDSFSVEDKFVIETDTGPIRFTSCPTDDAESIQQSYSLEDFVADDDPDEMETTLVITEDDVIDVLPFISSLRTE